MQSLWERAFAREIASNQSTSALHRSSRAARSHRGTAALGREDWQAFLQQHSKKPLPVDFSQQLAQLAYAPDETLRALPAQQRRRCSTPANTGWSIIMWQLDYPWLLLLLPLPWLAYRYLPAYK
jgi:hypothetical protein